MVTAYSVQGMSVAVAVPYRRKTLVEMRPETGEPAAACPLWVMVVIGFLSGFCFGELVMFMVRL